MSDKIIEILRNDYEYYNGIGRQYLSNSDIGTLLNNPQDFGKKREDNKAFAEGRYFHKLLLEPDKVKNEMFVDVSTRTTKEYKNFCETNNVAFVLLKKEMDEMERLASIMKGNIHFFDEIYKPGNKFEVPAITELFGLPFKGKTDIEQESDFLIDLKTTSDINKFIYSARAYNYDSQAFIYEKLFGKRMKFYVVDKESGQLGVYHVDDSFVEMGGKKVERAVEVYNKYFGPNKTEEVENHFVEATLHG